MRGLQENAKRHARGQKATNQATNRDTKEITKESREQGDKAHKATITPPPQHTDNKHLTMQLALFIKSIN